MIDIMPMEQHSKGYTLVIGLGVTGKSVARYLTARGDTPWLVDSRENPPGLDELRHDYPASPLFTGKFDSDLFGGAECLIVSPGVPLNTPAIQEAMANGVEVLGDVELFARQVNAPTVAITGSNGKSTVTTLVGNMAVAAGIKTAVGGNLGTPALDLLAQNAGLYVLELSSFQLETTVSLEPAAAAVLNISPDHMDRYANLSEYSAAKQRIYKNAETAVINLDDERVRSMSPRGRVIGFTLSEPGPGDFGLRWFDQEAWLCHGEHRLMKEGELRIGGRHNTANALAALALGTAIGLPIDNMLDTLREFQGLPHRTQWAGEYRGVKWYNDSKGTNIGASRAAIEGLPGKLVLIAGGDGKGADFAELRSVVADKVRAVVLIGRDAPLIEKALSGAAPIYHAGDMREAVAVADAHARSGDSVLLSPACASFDMFRDYRQRGEVFMAAVRELQQ